MATKSAPKSSVARGGYQGKRRGAAAPAAASRKPRGKKPPIVIDFHCHMRVPEVVEFCRGHGPDASVPPHPKYTEAAKKLDAEWAQMHRMRTGDMATRLALMDQQGVDIQEIGRANV